MAVTANSIITPQTPRSASAVAATANTDRASTAANAVVLWTAGANGSRITRVTAIPRASVTATELQLFRSTDGGATRIYLKSKTMALFTVVNTAVNPETDFGYSDVNPLILGANEILYCGIAVALASGIAFTAEGADY